ncbi:MAG TPA: AAA family ATPase [Polyangia bacterium]
MDYFDDFGARLHVGDLAHAPWDLGVICNRNHEDVQLGQVTVVFEELVEEVRPSRNLRDAAHLLVEVGSFRVKEKEQGLAELPRFDREAPPGWHRVLPGLQALLDVGEGADAALRTADKDVRERVAGIRKRLAHLGPDRRIAQPEGWREAIAGLETAPPHFREPTRLLRNALALAEATKRPVRVPPMLLRGPPGVGKTFFSHRVADLMGAAHACIAFDQPTTGAQLRGSDKHWGNSESGLLFNLVCLGECANPVILLDEIDKACADSGYRGSEPLAQLHGALEPETARRTLDISTDIEFDASLVTYIATANSIRGLGMPILSRLEVFGIELPDPSSAVEIARGVVKQVLDRLHLGDRLRFERKGLYVLAHLSPRLMLRTVEKAVAAAIAAGQGEVRESDLWAELGFEDGGPSLH